MSRCQCLTDKGKQCLRKLTHTAGANNLYCFQHRKCAHLKSLMGPGWNLSTDQSVGLPRKGGGTLVPGQVYCQELENKGLSCYFFYDIDNLILKPTKEFWKLIKNLESLYDDENPDFKPQKLFPGMYCAYLVDLNVGKIVGNYAGEILIDNKLRRYGYYPYISFDPKYIGFNVCQPFIKIAFSSTINKLGAKYIRLSIDSMDDSECKCYILRGLSGCKCYVSAALECGLKCFSLKGYGLKKSWVEIPNTNYCSDRDNDYIFTS